MSLYQKASLVQIPSGYKAADDKLYSVVPNNGDGDFTVTVAAGATRVNKDGLIESVVADQARLNYNFIDGVVQPDPHLLLEPSRNNFITRSEEFDNSYWTKEGVSIGTGILSPMGDADARNMIEQTSTGRHRVRTTLSVSSGTTYSLSVWVKSNNRNLVINAQALFNARSGFNLSNGSVENTTAGTATITEYSNDWYRCTVIGTATLTQTTVMYFQMQEGTTDVNYTGDGSSTLSLFGAQMEAGSYPTSYIPTTTGAVTRTLDNAHLLSQTLFTNYPFTVYAKASLDAIGNTIFSLNNTSSQNYYLAFYFPNSTQAGILRRDLSTNDSDFYSFSGSVGTTYKIAVAFVSATAYKLYIDGTQIANITSGGSIPFNHNDISLGQFRITGDTTTRNGIDEFMVFNEALSDSELQTLTS